MIGSLKAKLIKIGDGGLFERRFGNLEENTNERR